MMMVDEQQVKGSAFLQSMASGSHGAHVINTDRIFRLTVTIEAIKNINRGKLNSSLKDLFLKVTTDGKSIKFQINGKPDEHGILVVNQSFVFDVKDFKTSTLLVQVYKTGFFGIETCGQCKNILVSDLLKDEEGEGLINLKSKWQDLYSKDGGKVLPGKILMQVGAGVTRPEQKLHLFVGTWNVGNAAPGNNLSDWFTATSPYDMVAIGAQECDYSPRAPHTDCANDWVSTLKSALGSQYKLVHGLSRGQMRLVVFVHVDSQKAISEVLNGSEATGVGHVVSNKGGICVSLKFWDTSLCFVNCHFAAHEGHCEARNANYREIVGNIRVSNPNTDILNQFHHVFWLGDLNYRLDNGSTDQKKLTPNASTWDAVTEQIRVKEFDRLFAMDELRREQEAKRALYLFKEGEVTFPPTFKMQRDKEDAYERKRLPAWCDRVLWSSLPGCNVEQLSYSSTPSITSSDHKPVAATFALTAFALPCNSKEDLDKDDRRWHVRFAALRAKNLRASDFSGSSDPYVEFFGQNLFQGVQSKVKFQSLNPIWIPSKDIPTIVLDTFAIQRLEKEYILVRIVDFDYTSRDDTLGYGVIPLADVVAAFKDELGTCNFVVDLSHHGCPAGTLEGTFQVTWEKNVTKRRLQLTKSLIGRTKTMRHNLKRSILSKHVISERHN